MGQALFSRAWTRAFLVAALASTSWPVSAQPAEDQRIANLEARLADQERLLNAMRAELSDLRKSRQIDNARTALATEPDPPKLGAGWPQDPNCMLRTDAEIGAVLSDPQKLTLCTQAQLSEDALDYARRGREDDGVAPPQVPSQRQKDRNARIRSGEDKVRSFDGIDKRAAAAGTTTIAGRPLQAPGITPQVEFGSSGKASLTLSVPIRGRDCETASDRCSGGGNFSKMEPWTLTPSIQISTELNDGLGTLFDERDRSQRGDLDFVGGTSIKVGFDFLEYKETDRKDAIEAIDEFLQEKARPACLAAQEKKRVEKPDTGAGDNARCNADNLVQWIIEPAYDTETTHGFGYKRSELAHELRELFWQSRKNPVPNWGFGGSVSYSSEDFTFRQGSLALVPAMGDSKAGLSLDRSAPLADVRTEEKDNWLVEAHGLIYLDFADGHPGLTSPFHSSGMMLVPQVSYNRFYEYRPGTEFTLCSGATQITQPLDCDKVRVDRPYARELTSASLEARTEFLNVPVLRKLAIAPKYAYTFDDNSSIIDLPVYFADSKDNYSAGIRFRHGFGQNDAFGNPEKSYWQVSLFFTPLQLNGF